VSGIKHIDSTCMAETMSRINYPQPFRWEGHREVFFTDAIDAMPCKFLSPLIDINPAIK
jgi:hypothetical protein